MSKKAKRKIEDLQVDASTSAKVKGGQTSVTPMAPSRASIFRAMNKLFRPKS